MKVRPSRSPLSRFAAVAAAVGGLALLSSLSLNRSPAVAPTPAPPSKIVSAKPPWEAAEFCLAWLQKRPQYHLIKVLQWKSREPDLTKDELWFHSPFPADIHCWCTVTAYYLCFTDDTETKSVIRKGVFQVSFDGVILGFESKESDIN